MAGGPGGDNLNTNSRVGPGGGGGGGRIRAELPAGAKPKLEVTAGPGGFHYRVFNTGAAPMTKDHYGATDGQAGVAETM